MYVVNKKKRGKNNKDIHNFLEFTLEIAKINSMLFNLITYHEAVIG